MPPDNQSCAKPPLPPLLLLRNEAVTVDDDRGGERGPEEDMASRLLKALNRTNDGPVVVDEEPLRVFDEL